MFLRMERRLFTGRAILDQNISDLEIISGSDGTYLYSATGRHGGLAVWSLEGRNQPDLVEQTLYRGLFNGASLPDLEVARFWGADRLIYGNQWGQILSATLQSDGQISDLRSHAVPVSNISSLEIAALSGGGEGFFAIDVRGNLSSWYIPAQGATVVHRSPVTQLGAVGSQLETVEVGGQNYLITADSETGQLSSFSIAPRGFLQRIEQADFSRELGLSVPNVLETVQAFGMSWAFVGGAGSQTLSVLRVLRDGTLRPTEHLMDSRDTRFGGIQAIEIVSYQGHVLVIAGGADDGLSLFMMHPTGRLFHLQSVPHTVGSGLRNISDIVASQQGDTLQIFVSGAEAGLSQFTLFLNDLGRVLTNLSPGAQRLTGTEGADMITARGADTLQGGAGDDILVSGAGGATLTGGAGQDRFILQEGDRVTIRDFERRADHLDLSDLPSLRNPDQISLSSTRTGAILFYNDFEAVITASDRQPLTLEDLWPRGFQQPDRVMGAPFIPGVLRSGTPGQDRISGSAGGDTIWGGAGNDEIWAVEGNDQISGGAGNDRAFGSSGSDTIWGGSGADTLGGGVGNDTISGGQGWDELWGAAGNDSLNGGPGNDLLGAYHGNDTLEAGSGNDTIWSYYGDDRLNGGTGNDEMWGSYGDDRLEGGAGNDTLGGAWGRDRLWGGDGNDLMYGGAEADRLFGGGGQDTLVGGTGNDRLDGGAGTDRLRGDSGNDLFVFRQGHGRDTIMDFAPGEDRIQLRGTLRSFESLDLREVNGGTLIDTGGGQIYLETVTRSMLDADDFLFS